MPTAESAAESAPDVLPFALKVCGLATLAETAATHRCSHLVSLVDPEIGVVRPAGVAPGDHLVRHFHDVAEAAPDHRAPEAADMAAVLAFGRAVPAGARLVVHCHVGRSRSTAMAIALVLQAFGGGGGRVEPAVAWVRRIAPWMAPNRRLIRFADAALHAEGSLIACVERVAAECQPYHDVVQWMARGRGG